MPEEWGKKSVLVTIFKNQGNVKSFGSYIGIKLMSHTIKI